MSVRIDFLVSNELNDQIEIFCSSTSTSKHQWITGLIKKEISVFFKEHEQKKILRESWSIENRLSDGKLMIIGESTSIPPAY